MAEEKRQKPKISGGMYDHHFYPAVAAVSAIGIAHVYYGVMSYQWAMQNMPQGYDYPYAWKFVYSLFGLIFFGLQKELVVAFIKPKMEKWCKQQESPELHKIYVEKATKNVNAGIFKIVSVTWAYSMLRNSVWIPWWLGSVNP